MEKKKNSGAHAPDSKSANAKKSSAPKSKSNKTAKETVAKPKLAPVAVLRVECVAGPWLDEKCARFIAVPMEASLYDLHLAILDSVEFDEDFPFHFFTALAPEGARRLVPEDADGNVEPEEIDPDVYEDILVLENTKSTKHFLFYAIGSNYEDWIFRVQQIGEEAAVPEEFYPLVLDDRSEGPNPEQYGSGFDDFAEKSESFTPSERLYADDGDDESLDDDDVMNSFFGSSGNGIGDGEEDDDFFGEDEDGEGGDEDFDDIGGDDDEW
jgi:hypothetical protein